MSHGLSVQKDLAALSSTPIYGLEDIMDRYDGFILDLWGVLHNGTTPYEGAVEALEAMRARGKHVVLLSNNPGPHQSVMAQMARIGFPDALYDTLITSGDLTAAAILSGAYGKKGLFYGIDGTPENFTRHGIALAASSQEADFILNVWFGAPDELSSIDGTLREWAARSMPMLCANPDIEVMTAQGMMCCAGAAAARYSALGGKVRYFGKPHAPAFKAALAALDRLGVAPSRAIMVGDGLDTDVLGGDQAGIDTLWVMGGKHLPKLGCAWGMMPDAEVLTAALAKAPAAPTYIIPRFVREF